MSFPSQGVTATSFLGKERENFLRFARNHCTLFLLLSQQQQLIADEEYKKSPSPNATPNG
jgi:hypothetical protein